MDEHPLVPYIRQLRGGLEWLRESGISEVELALDHAIRQRFRETPKLKFSDPSAIKKRTHDADKLKEALSVIQKEQRLQLPKREETRPSSPLDHAEHSKIKEDLDYHNSPPPALPLTQFPLVIHERIERESISFERPPPPTPSDHEVIEVMRPLPALQARLRSILGHPLAHDEPTEEAPLPHEDLTSPIALDLQDDEQNIGDIPEQKVPQAQFWVNQPPADDPKIPPKQLGQDVAKRDLFTRGLSSVSSLSKVENPSLKVTPGEETVNRRTEGEGLLIIPDFPKERSQRQQAWRALNAQQSVCQSCPRHSHRKLINYGVGDREARLVFVVAHPTEYSDMLGLQLADPEEGKLFSEILQAMTLNRGEIYLTSLVKCAPRRPNFNEWASCQPYFQKELELIRPEIIVSLGMLTSQILHNGAFNYGEWGTYESIPIISILSPAEVLRGGYDSKKMCWEQVIKIMNRLGLESPR